jgi:hypothetical protein
MDMRRRLCGPDALSFRGKRTPAVRLVPDEAMLVEASRFYRPDGRVRSDGRNFLSGEHCWPVRGRPER